MERNRKGQLPAHFSGENNFIADNPKVQQEPSDRMGGGGIHFSSFLFSFLSFFPPSVRCSSYTLFFSD